MHTTLKYLTFEVEDSFSLIRFEELPGSFVFK